MGIARVVSIAVCVAVASLWGWWGLLTLVIVVPLGAAGLYVLANAIESRRERQNSQQNRQQ